MRVIRDFSRQSLPFYPYPFSEIGDDDMFSENFKYKTNKVKIAPDVNLNWEVEIVDAIKPLLYDTISIGTHCPHPGFVYLSTTAKVFLKVFDDHRESTDLILTVSKNNVQPLSAEDISTQQTIIYLDKPFELHVSISNNLRADDDDDRNVNIESDDEFIEIYDDGMVYEPLPPKVKPFKADHCVVCIFKDPRLFVPTMFTLLRLSGLRRGSTFSVLSLL